MSRHIFRSVRDYYDRRIAAFGPTPEGVDWNSRASQELRFMHLLRLWDLSPGDTLLDFGCGYGALADYVQARWPGAEYTGYDISDEMLDTAERLHDSSSSTFVRHSSELPGSDYVVASGVFNVMGDIGRKEWASYARSEILAVSRLARRGLAFNLLTLYSDVEKRRDDLYYADPPEWFDWCVERFGRHVALLHDYPLYEFTLVVTKDA